MPREQTLTNHVLRIEERASDICEQFKDFIDGPRMIMLIQREKDGGSHKEEKRSLSTRFTFGPVSFKRALAELLMLRPLYENSRIYANVNKRNLKKVIRCIEGELLDSHYVSDLEQKTNTYMKLIKSPRHFFMQPSVREESLFLIDVDITQKEPDALAEPLKLIAHIGCSVLLQYKTKNGYHLITTPFNPALWTHSSEIKKDGLMLLDF
jgi:hypothetical protein